MILFLQCFETANFRFSCCNKQAKWTLRRWHHHVFAFVDIHVQTRAVAPLHKTHGGQPWNQVWALTAGRGAHSHIVNCWSERKGLSSLFDRIDVGMALKAEETLKNCSLAIMLEPSHCLYTVSSINRFAVSSPMTQRYANWKGMGFGGCKSLSILNFLLLVWRSQWSAFTAEKLCPWPGIKQSCLLSAYIAKSRGMFVYSYAPITLLFPLKQTVMCVQPS